MDRWSSEVVTNKKSSRTPKMKIATQRRIRFTVLATKMNKKLTKLSEFLLMG